MSAFKSMGEIPNLSVSDDEISNNYPTIESIVDLAKAPDKRSRELAAVGLAFQKLPAEVIESLVLSPWYSVTELAVLNCQYQPQLSDETLRKWMGMRNSSIRRAAVRVMSARRCNPDDLIVAAKENEYQQVRNLVAEILL